MRIVERLGRGRGEKKKKAELFILAAFFFFLPCLIKSQWHWDFSEKEHSPVCSPGNRGDRAGPEAGMAAGLLGSENVPCSWDLACRVLRTCREGNLHLLQLMLKPWCIPTAVYQVGLKLTFLCYV